MALSQIVGQETAVAAILGMISRGRIATSYLFSGEQGIGKKTTALGFAKALNCQRAGIRGQVSEEQNALGLEIPQETQGMGIDSCDICESCLKIESGTHPDVLFIAPEERQIRIDEIRKIEDALAFRPFEGKFKVVILDEADAMNAPAANAFLKTLEEPPDSSIIILITSRPDRLPATIRSRCSRISFRPLSLKDSTRVLKGRIPDEVLELVAKNTMGRPGTALSSDVLEERTWFWNILEAMLRSERDGWASREEMDRWLEICIAFLRDMAVLKIAGKEKFLIQGDLKTRLEGMSKSLDAMGIIKLYEEIRTLKGLMVFNLNKAITWNYTASLLRKGMSSNHA